LLQSNTDAPKDATFHALIVSGQFRIVFAVQRESIECVAVVAPNACNRLLQG
jgi:hypothetical protein